MEKNLNVYRIELLLISLKAFAFTLVYVFMSLRHYLKRLPEFEALFCKFSKNTLKNNSKTTSFSKNNQKIQDLFDGSLYFRALRVLILFIERA